MQISEKLILMSANGEIAPMSSTDAMVIEAALTATEPVAAMTTDYLGCEYVSMDVAGIEKIAATHSKGPTKVVYLYAAPPAPSVAVKALHSALDTLRYAQKHGFHDRVDEAIVELEDALSAQVQDVASLPDDYYSDDPAKLKQLLAQRDKWLVDNDHWHDFTRSLPAAPAKQEGGE